MHQVWLLTFHGSLTAPSLPADFNPKSVWDIGCGTGIWAIEYASRHSEAEVFATDIISPTIPSSLRNLTFKVEDAEQPWSINKKFDYIHVRLLTIIIRDWPTFFQQCWEHLNPGGWLEVQDVCIPCGAENPESNCETSPLIRNTFVLYEALMRQGIDVIAIRYHPDRLKVQGFVNAHQERFKWPANGKWPAEERMKAIGDLNSKIWIAASGTMIPKLLRTFNMEEETINNNVRAFREELENDVDKRLYLPM